MFIDTHCQQRDVASSGRALVVNTVRACSRVRTQCLRIATKEVD